MNFKKIVIEFITIFAISLVVCIGVTFLWNLVFHGVAIIDWETSFRFAILFGIIFPIINSRKNKFWEVQSAIMFEKQNQPGQLEKYSKQNFYFSLLSILCLILSLTVFYPLSMKVDKYSTTILTILAYSFYILQGTSFLLTIVTFIKSIPLVKAKKNYLNYFVLIISILVFTIFGYELYWFLIHI